MADISTSIGSTNAVANSPARRAPASPWPEKHGTAAAEPEDGIELGLGGKILGVLMDMPRPTARKKLTPEQVAEIQQTLAPGDVILETNDEYPGWQLNAKLLLKSDWVHAALYVGNNTIVDSTTERNGVAPIQVEDFCHCHHLAIIRPEYKTDADLQAALKYAQDKTGTPYDFDWSLSNNTLYCTEFVADALAAGPNPIHVATRKVLGQEMVSPQAFLQSPEMKTVWSTGSNYYSNLAYRARPFAVQAGIGVGTGLIASALGAGPGVAAALGVAAGGALFVGSMMRIYKRDKGD